MTFSGVNNKPMLPIIPDVKKNQFGVCSPNSPTESYSCAFPSWPNRSYLTNTRFSRSSSGAVTGGDFLEQLRRQARPEESIEEDDEDENSGPTTTSPRESWKSDSSCSLLSRALSQLPKRGADSSRRTSTSSTHSS